MDISYEEYLQKKRDSWKKWYGENRDKRRELRKKSDKAYQDRNRKELNAKASEYRKKNRYYFRIRKRLGKQISAGVIELRELFDSYLNRCAYCFNELGDNSHIDHFVPISKGGGNEIENLVPSCPSCNQSKFNHSLIVWLAKR